MVANGYSLELMTDQMGQIVSRVKPGLAVIVTPMPRYLDPCCETHLGGRTEEQLEADRLKLIKAVWNLKRETFQLVAKNHLRNVIVVSPLEILGIKDSVEEVRKGDAGRHPHERGGNWEGGGEHCAEGRRVLYCKKEGAD